MKYQNITHPTGLTTELTNGTVTFADKPERPYGGMLARWNVERNTMDILRPGNPKTMIGDKYHHYPIACILRFVPSDESAR
jgi:hypothetical protein